MFSLPKSHHNRGAGAFKRRHLGWVLFTTLVLSGCGSAGGHGAAAVTKQLRHAGWKVSAATGMPHTLSGKPQRFFLQTVAPDGEQLTLQFFANSQQAALERKDAREKLHLTNLTSVGDAFVRAVGSRQIEPKNLATLQRLLTT